MTEIRIDGESVAVRVGCVLMYVCVGVCVCVVWSVSACEGCACPEDRSM